MNLIQLLALLIPSSPDTRDDQREVLRDHPRCGQLGDPGKKECYWGCNWVNNTLFGQDD